MSVRASLVSASAPRSDVVRACPSGATGLRLSDDLHALHREASRISDLVVQLRHHDARLVVSGLPELGARLRLPARAEGPVIGHAALCACCGSPGRLALHDAARHKILQLCAPADCTSYDWMDLLLDLFPRFPAASGSTFTPASWSEETILSSDARPPQALCALLNRLWAGELVFDVTLHNGAFSLSTPLAPESGNVARGLLCLRAPGATLQLLLASVRRLVVTRAGRHPALEIHTREAGETVVLRSAAPAWRRALADLEASLG